MDFTAYVLNVLRNGGCFRHLLTETGYRTKLYDENDNVVPGFNAAHRWDLWNQGLLDRTETRNAEVASHFRDPENEYANDYVATFRLKENDG